VVNNNNSRLDTLIAARYGSSETPVISQNDHKSWCEISTHASERPLVAITLVSDSVSV